jgi:hypothetical protein
MAAHYRQDGGSLVKERAEIEEAEYSHLGQQPPGDGTAKASPQLARDPSRSLTLWCAQGCGSGCDER